MTFVQKRVTVAYNDADPKPDVITLPREQWHQMLDGYNGALKDLYISQGFYIVGTKKQGKLRRRKDTVDVGVEAFMFRGVPVVVAEDYAAMMHRHTSRRIVLAL